jgi:hypothetical protein
VAVFPAVAAVALEFGGVAAASAATTTTSLAFALAAGLALGARSAPTSRVAGVLAFAAASAFARFRAAVADKMTGSVAKGTLSSVEIRVVLPEA